MTYDEVIALPHPEAPAEVRRDAADERRRVAPAGDQDRERNEGQLGPDRTGHPFSARRWATPPPGPPVPTATTR